MTKFVTIVSMVSMCILLIAVDVQGYGDDCENQKFCETKPPHYDEHQDDMDSKFKIIKEVLPLDGEGNSDGDRNIFVKNEGNCPYIKRTMKPYTIKGKPNLLVVQTEFFSQTFEVTECAKKNEYRVENEVCFDDIGVTNSGSCTEQKIDIILYMYDIEKKTIRPVRVPIPVCCFCHLSE